MVVNGNACCLNQRGALESIASKLAPTMGRVNAKMKGSSNWQKKEAAHLSRLFVVVIRERAVSSQAG